MKQYPEAPQLYELAQLPEKAASIYIGTKDKVYLDKAAKLMPSITNPKVHAATTVCLSQLLLCLPSNYVCLSQLLCLPSTNCLTTTTTTTTPLQTPP